MSNAQTIKPTRMDWSIKDNKRINDGAINKMLREEFVGKGDINALTFPGPNWIYEKELAEEMPEVNFLFQGVEKDQDLYDQAFKTVRYAKKPNATFVLPQNKKSLKQFLGHLDDPWNDEPFDLVYPDWMGTWAKDKKEAIRRAFARKIFADSSWLAMTLMLGRGTKNTLEDLMSYIEAKSAKVFDGLEMDNRTLQAMLKSKTGSLKVMGISEIVAQEARLNGYEANLHRIRVYDSHSNINDGYVTPEMSLLYKVTKNEEN